MFILRNLIEQYTKLYVCFVDFQKAFDFVLHSALLYKLAKLDINGPFRNIIQHIDQYNILYVHIQNKLTCSFKPKIGVLQGNNISPIFSKYFSMICQIFLMKEIENNFIS